jgi:hypothetical protein
VPATTGTDGSSIVRAAAAFFSALAARLRASQTAPPTINKHTTTTPTIFPLEDFGFGASLPGGGGLAFTGWSDGGIVRWLVISSIGGIS